MGAPTGHVSGVSPLIWRCKASFAEAYGNSVYVVGPQKDKDGKAKTGDKGQPALAVERRYVKTGERREGSVVILDGLKAGEQVVTSGQLKLDSGTPVAIVPDAQ